MHLVRVGCRPVENDESATAHAFQHCLAGETLLPHQVCIKGIPARNCFWVSKQVANLAIDHMPAALQQCPVRLRFMPPEPRPPNPRLSFRDFPGYHDPAGCIALSEVVEIITLPLARFPGEFSKKEYWKQKGEEKRVVQFHCLSGNEKE